MENGARKVLSLALAACVAIGLMALPAYAESEGADGDFENPSISQSRYPSAEPRESEGESEPTAHPSFEPRESEAEHPSPTPSGTPSSTPSTTPSSTPSSDPSPTTTPSNSSSPTPSTTPTHVAPTNDGSATPTPTLTNSPPAPPAPPAPEPTPSAGPTPTPTKSPDVVVPASNNPGNNQQQNTPITQQFLPWQPLSLMPVASAPQSGRATVNGIQIPAILRASISRKGLEFLAAGWQVNLGALTALGESVDITDDGSLRVQRDHDFVASGSGFAPNSQVDVYVYSSPIKLGTLQTDAAGEFTGNFPVPKQLEDGQHTLQVMGYSPTGAIQEGEIPVTIFQAAPVIYTTQTYTKSQIIYFKNGLPAALKRSQKPLRAMLATISSLRATNTQITGISLAVHNTRREPHPTRALATKRMRSLYRAVKLKAGPNRVTRQIAQMRRNHWAYALMTVTYRK